MRKILKSYLSPGDIVMLTAAVRDLHLCYPYQYKTGVDTSCPELWENNPYISKLDMNDQDVEIIDCHYPLVHQSDQKPYHFIHGYIAFLNEQLGLNIKPTAFKGDIHVSDLEKSWIGQVQEIVKVDIPFWIIDAGGKTDYTIKWWDAARYQKVVDHFRGKIQFVQVGAVAHGHYHPRLNGVIDLRGKTDLRQLVRLVYHSQGVLCPITGLMHLAAAIETKTTPQNRPCVVIAGGREPVHWEAYPQHQFIHTIGALPCCDSGGCWKSRTGPLGDGDEKDNPDSLCVDVVNGLPHCMDMITAEEVIRRIEGYFEGGTVQYLSDGVKIPADAITSPVISLEVPLDLPGGAAGIHQVDIHTGAGMITYYPNISARPIGPAQHDLFKPATLEEAIETVVGDCNGFTAKERWEKETPLFAEYILKNLSEGQNVLLDYGCGVGRIAKEILRQKPDIQVIGVDTSEYGLKLAREYVASERFIAMQPHELDQPVDLAYSVYVLQHVPAIELREILQRIYHYLKEDGLFIHCSSEYRMAIRYDEASFYDDKHLGVDIQAELSRYFALSGMLFPPEILDANPLVRAMVNGDNDGIAHPALVFRKRILPDTPHVNYRGDGDEDSEAPTLTPDKSAFDYGEGNP